MIKNASSQGFAIWDHEKNQWWTTRQGKKLWNAVGHAKNAWNNAFGSWRRDTPRFDEQDRYTVHPVLFLAVTEVSSS